MNKKIIAVDLRALIGGNTSGVETYIHKLLDELIKWGQDNEQENKRKGDNQSKNTQLRNKPPKVTQQEVIYVLYLNAFSDQNEIIKRYEGIENVILVQTRIPNKIFNLSLMLLRWPKLDKVILKKTGLSPDVFFAPDLRPCPVSESVKKVCTVHDLAFDRMPRLYSLKCRLWFWLLRPARELAEANKIIAVSEFTKADLMK